MKRLERCYSVRVLRIDQTDSLEPAFMAPDAFQKVTVVVVAIVPDEHRTGHTVGVHLVQQDLDRLRPVFTRMDM
jgi:hypothetical protein